MNTLIPGKSLMKNYCHQKSNSSSELTNEEIADEDYRHA